ncbi:MAG: DUF177 domain-containing protein [Candidatus Eremiobacteraeota bacterium]|nr:DUF177 domain-containing protein [Candidatus Eremiobacteraeota bacterium]
MKIKIKDITKQLGLSLDYTYQGDFPIREIDFEGPISLELKLTHTGREILLEGTLETSVELECSRCLEIFLLPLKLDIFEEFVKREAPPSPGGEGELDEANLYYGDYINIREVIRQNILSNLPMNPLCDPGCRGICPGCGVNLNIEPCSCMAETGQRRSING